jgi:DNA-binding CsgD family transcriptional regulator
LKRSRGRAFNLTLDGAIATFDGPARAVQFAEAIAVGMRRLGLRTRLGVHTGEVEIGCNGISGEGEIGCHSIGGKAVHLATRIAAQARPGEVLVSETVAGLVAGSGLAFTPVDAGESVALPADCRILRVDTGEVPRTVSVPAQRTKRLQAASAPAFPLTPREREVVTLLARGQSNREIGSDLAISVATAERHVSNIMTKLGVRTRTQIAAWAAGLERGSGAVVLSSLGYDRSTSRLSALAAD